MAEVLTAAGWSVIILEKGRNHLLDLAPPHEPLRHFANDEIALPPPPPPRARPAARAAHLPADARRRRSPPHRRRQQPARRRSAAAACTPTPSSPASARRTSGSCSERGPIDGARDRGLAARLRRPRAALRRGRARLRRGRRGRRQPVRGVAQLAVPDAARRRHADGGRVVGGGRAGRAAPVPGADRREQRRVRRPARVRRLRVLRRLRLPDPRQGRPDRGAAARPADRPVRAAARRAASTELVLDASGRRATGVRYLDLTGYPDPPVVEVRATRAVVLAAGAFETPRLLLRNGLGGDAVGRYLTYHFQTFTVGIFPEPTGGERGRSVTHLHDDLMIDTPGAARRRPRGRAALAARRRGGARRRPGPDRRGQHLPGRRAAHLPSMQDSALRRRLWVFTMQGEDLPQATNRIDLDPSVRDAWGLPAGRVTYSPHRHELAASAYAAPLHEAIMRDAGADFAFSATSPPQGELDLHSGQPDRRRPGQQARDGHRPHGHRPDHVGRVARAAPLGRRQRPRVRLVGLRHQRRLQPHPHPGRPRPPRRHR